MSTEKKLLNVAEIENQVALELPSREVMSYGGYGYGLGAYGAVSPLFAIKIAPITINTAIAANYCPGTAALYAKAEPVCYALALAGTQK